jgi:hypothetical protein
MTRLCALVFTLVGAVIGLVGALIAATASFANRLDGVADVVKSLAILATAFVASGAVALLTRTRPNSNTDNE